MCISITEKNASYSLFLQRLFAKLAEGAISLQDYHDPIADVAKHIQLFPEAYIPCSKRILQPFWRKLSTYVPRFT